MRKVVLIVICLFAKSFAEEALPLFDSGRGVPIVVGGCVNVVTGDYLEQECDLSLTCPAPLSFERSYCSGDSHVRSLFCGWRHNHDAQITYFRTGEHKAALFTEASGRAAFYKGKERGGVAKLKYQPNKRHANCGCGAMCARTNIQNSYLEKGQEKGIKVHKAVGSEQFFGKYKTGLLENEPGYACDILQKLGIVETPVDYYRIESQTLLSGNKIAYCYDRKGYLTEILSTDGEGKTIFGKLHFSLDKERDVYTITSSEGKSVSYYLNDERFGERKKKYCIRKVVSTDAPTVCYTYDDSRRIKKRMLPNYRYKMIRYDDEGRVCTIREPVGEGPDPKVLYQFFYRTHTGVRNGNHYAGFTTVVDANGGCVRYEYDKHKRLIGVLKTFCRKGKLYPYSSENYRWDEKGQLSAQELRDWRNKTLVTREFAYDPFGNIVSDTTVGNISGEGEGESYTRRYRYSEDGLHLLLEEEEENGYRVEYGYVPDTDLIASKCIYNRDALLIRTFYTYDCYGTLAKVVRDDGVSEQLIQRFKNNARGLPEEIEDCYLESGQEKLLRKKVLRYTPEGKVAQEAVYDADGVHRYTLFWEYDAHGNVIREVDALGQVTRRRYDANDNLLLEKGEYAKKYSYDYSNRLIKETVEGQETRYTYDHMSNVSKTRDTNGLETHYTYDPFNRLIKLTHPTGFEEHFIYDAMGNVVQHTDQNGQVTKKAYTVFGKPSHIHYPDDTEERFTYDAKGNVIQHVAKNGLLTKYRYDVLGRRISEEQFSQAGESLAKRTWRYNAFHLFSETDAEGITTTYTYDKAGRLSKMEREELCTTYTYDALGRERTVGNGYCERIKEYDLLGRVIEERIGDERICYSYDREGNVVAKNGTSITYDFRKRPLTITDPEGNTTHYEYEGLQTIVTDPAGYQTITEKNAFDKEASVCKRDPFGVTLSQREFTYSPTGQLVGIIDTVFVDSKLERTIETRYHYEGTQLVQFIEAAGAPEQRITHYGYNAHGEKAKQIKPDGTEIFYTYDPLGRVEALRSSDGSIFYTYCYNQSNLPTEITDCMTHQTTTRTYRGGRLLSETLATGYTFHYSYDPLGRLTEITYPDLSTVSYSYDSYYLREVKRGELTYRPLAYNEKGKLIEAELPDGSHLTYRYDSSYRVCALSHRQREHTIDAFDERGNPTQIDGVAHTYDGLNQLTEDGVHTYAYDSLHNRVGKDSEAYHYNVLNQREGYTYECNGNLLSDGVNTYRYDALDRLIEANGVCYSYDPFNRRLTKGDEDFLYVQNCEVGCVQSGVIEQLRVLRSLQSEIGETVLIEIGGVSYIPLHDLQGNIVQLFNLEGEVVECYSYTPFGEEKGKGSLSPWRYSGKRVDEESGLICFGCRFYDPVQGRFLNPDPLGNADGPNLYAYVRNNPCTHFDAFGLWGVGRYGKYLFGSLFTSFGISFSTNWMDYFFAPFTAPISLFGPPRELSTVKVHKEEAKSPVQPKPVQPKSHKLVCYINGVRNDEEAYSRGQTFISDLSGEGVEVIGVEHETQSAVGILDDFLRFFKFKITQGLSNASQELLTIWSDFCIKNTDERDRILQVCHSEGAQHVLNALKACPQEIRERIEVVVIAGAAYIDDDLCHRVWHYISLRDIVPLVDVFGLIRAFFQGTVWVLSPHPDAPWFDHSLLSPTYRDSLQERIDKFKGR